MIRPKAIVTFLLLNTGLLLCGQTTEPVKNASFFPVVKNVPKVVAVHVPAGYQVLYTKTGNLNLDTIPDLLMVLKSPTEDTTNDIENPVQRPLLLLLGTKNGSYTLEFRNNKVVSCIICGGMMGDPFNGITIKYGYFTVAHYGGSSWRWTNFITFRYNPTDKHFYLHRIDNSNFHTSNPNKVEKTVKTPKNFGKVDFMNYEEKYNQ